MLSNLPYEIYVNLEKYSTKVTSPFEKRIYMQNGVASKRMHTVLLPENQYFSFRDTLNALQAVNYKDATYVLRGISEDEEEHQVHFYYNFLSFISCCYTDGI